MKARVKACDHINLDGLGLGTASIISEALKHYEEFHAGNEVKVGLSATARIEVNAAIEEAEALRDGVSKELRKKRREEAKAERKVIKSDTSSLFDDESARVAEMEDEPQQLVTAESVLISSETDRCD